MSSNMEPVYCCGKPMSPIYHAARQQHRGWWCHRCSRFEAATGREYKFPLQLKDKPND